MIDCSRVVDLVAQLAGPARKVRRTPRLQRIRLWCDVLRRDPCVYCGRRPAGTVDHITPRSQGAPRHHTMTNSAPACRACNQRRGPRSLLEFLIVRKRETTPPPAPGRPWRAVAWLTVRIGGVP